MLRLNSLHETDFQKSDGDANPKSNRPMQMHALKAGQGGTLSSIGLPALQSLVRPYERPFAAHLPSDYKGAQRALNRL